MDSKKISIPEAFHKQRLDKALAALLPEFTRARLQSLIAEGCVTLNGEAIEDASRKVKTDECYHLVIPELKTSTLVAQEIPLDIVYEDNDILIINKPPGLTVHPGAGNADGTLVNALLAHCGESLSGIGGVARPGIVHRIDKDTSGLLAVAKHDNAHVHLSKQLETRTLSRTYLALVWGVPSPKRGTISAPITRSTSNRQKMAVAKVGGKEAITHYQVGEEYGSIASLVECRLQTGRTHQIRVHMQHIKHPIIGDETYGGKRKSSSKWPERVAEALQHFPRQALHAWKLKLIHPVTAKEMEFEAEFPEDMEELIEVLERL